MNTLTFIALKALLVITLGLFILQMMVVNQLTSLAVMLIQSLLTLTLTIQLILNIQSKVHLQYQLYQFMLQVIVIHSQHFFLVTLSPSTKMVK